jgi:DNA-binding CsgD family transcriptional regulator
MDWEVVAQRIADHANLPILLLGEQRELMLISPEAARELGIESIAADERRIDALVPPDALDDVRGTLALALSGARRTIELRMVIKGRAALARFSSSVVGGGEARGILLVLERLSPLFVAPPVGDYDYEVTGIEQGKHSLKWVALAGSTDAPADGECFAILHQRGEPCDACPLSRGETHTARSDVGREGSLDYSVTSVVARGDDSARLSVRRVASSSIAAVMKARLDELAERARLSKRERSVFAQLIEGRGVHEIASGLAISPRTVKFHQANVLHKLGADSRNELMRLVF